VPILVALPQLAKLHSCRTVPCVQRVHRRLISEYNPLFFGQSHYSLVLSDQRALRSFGHRCSVCGNESESSKNLVDFYELEVNVKGFEDLSESLDDYLREEILEGDNQYMCEHCNARVDATRSVKLRSLPPLLNFQLKRFVFNNKVWCPSLKSPFRIGSD
jgi:ubiquitin C-terminal hydrolase